MHDHSWMLAFLIIGPMLLGIVSLFIGLAVYSSSAAKKGSPPGAVSYQTAPTEPRTNAGPNKSGMHKSGALVLEPGTCKTRFADVAGCDEAKEELQEIVQYLLAPDIFAEMGAKLPKGVLLVGPPGTGKTLLAKAVAGESKAAFMSISGPSFVEMYVGIGAARVRDLFKEARKRSPCIIFIDEIDAVGRKRSNSPNSNDERENTLNQLLVELDGFVEVTGLVVIAATNRSDILDPALIRPGRFDRHVNVELPDRNGRQAIFNVHVRNKPLARSVDIAELARITPGLSGAEIEGVCNEAATLAARRVLKARAMTPDAFIVKEILPGDFDEALLRVQVGVAENGRTRAFSKKQLFNTAVHEVGHGWVSEAVEGGSTVNRITVLARGASLGHTMAVPDIEESSLSKVQVLGRIAVLLAGRLAQEEILGVADSGAGDDFRKSCALARQYVTAFGMSSLGAAAALDADNQDGSSRLGPRFADEIDTETRKVIEACADTARTIVKRDAAAIKVMAQLLVEKETMLKSEWQAAKQAVLEGKVS